LQFSTDGKYALAQDDSEIVVFSLEPLSVLYHVPADKEVLGQFTPDSREFVFVASAPKITNGPIRTPRETLRVERWSVTNPVRISSTVIPELTCGTASLSPDGRTFVCDDFNGALHIIEVSTSKEIFTKKAFASPSSKGAFEMIDLSAEETLAREKSGSLGGVMDEHGPLERTLASADFGFSPDGRYLVAIPKNAGPAIVWDIDRRNVVKSRGKIKLLSKATFNGDLFAFVAPDRLAIVLPRWQSWRKGSECWVDVVAFPTGDVVSSSELPHCPGGPSFAMARSQRPFRRATDPNLLIIDYEEVLDRGVLDSIEADSSPVTIRLAGRKARIDTCAFEFKTGRIVQSASPAFDVFGSRYVNELHPGEVGLWDIDKGLLGSIKVSSK